MCNAMMFIRTLIVTNLIYLAQDPLELSKLAAGLPKTILNVTLNQSNMISELL